ncbi:MAG: trk system potassium uptake protein TrkA [Myxococcota bacterium]|jgi:trk system potassium uptake protein TrkA
MQKFAVIGLGRFGFHVTSSLAELGAEVLAIDRDPEKCDAVKRIAGVHPLCLDATDEIALAASAIVDVDAAVVAIAGTLEASVIATALLKRMNVHRIIARAMNDVHRQILELIGATQVYNPEVEMGQRAAQAIFAPDLRDRMTLPTGHVMAEVDAREPIWGKTLGELDFRSRYELRVIAVKRRHPHIDALGENTYRTETNMLPTRSDALDRGDSIVVIGTAARVQEFLELWR